MIPASEEFRERLKFSRQFTVEADILSEGKSVHTGLDVISGSVTADSSSEIRRRTKVELRDPKGELVPDSSSGILWPNGNEIKLRYGMLLSSGVEYVDLGVFRVARPKFSDDGSTLNISVQGYDRSRTIRRNKFTQPYVIEAGTNYAVAIRQIIEDRFPFELNFDNFMNTERTTPRLFFEAQENPWKVVQGMASSLGAELFFNSSGDPVLRPEPDPESGSVSWDYVEGEDCTMTALQRDLDDERTYNHVVVVGESTSNEEAVRAEAVDDNPDSPTYVDGPYGSVTYFQTSQFITTTSQAQDAADAALRRVLGTVEQVTFDGVPHPLHEPGDILRIERERLSVNARYVLDAITIPLQHDETMSGATRQRRL